MGDHWKRVKESDFSTNRNVSSYQKMTGKRLTSKRRKVRLIKCLVINDSSIVPKNNLRIHECHSPTSMT